MKHTPFPSKFDRYLLLEEMGRGGFGVVYRAADPATGTEVALKVLREGRGQERFLREGEFLSKLEHPNIVGVERQGTTDDGAAFMALTLLQGTSLLGELRGRGAFPADEAVAIVLAILDALCAAHAQGIVHRDLKPANIFLASRGDAVIPVLLDFGISRELDRRTRLSAGRVLGTAGYTPPEVLLGADAGPAADVWALAIVFVELVTGRRAFGARGADVVPLVLRGAPVGLEDVPAHIRPVIERALAPLERRYASAAAFHFDLKSVFTQTQVRMTAPRRYLTLGLPQTDEDGAIPLGPGPDTVVVAPRALPSAEVSLLNANRSRDAKKSRRAARIAFFGMLGGLSLAGALFLVFAGSRMWSEEPAVSPGFDQGAAPGTSPTPIFPTRSHPVGSPIGAGVDMSVHPATRPVSPLSPSLMPVIEADEPRAAAPMSNSALAVSNEVPVRAGESGSAGAANPRRAAADPPTMDVSDPPNGFERRRCRATNDNGVDSGQLRALMNRLTVPLRQVRSCPYAPQTLVFQFRGRVRSASRGCVADAVFPAIEGRRIDGEGELVCDVRPRMVAWR